MNAADDFVQDPSSLWRANVYGTRCAFCAGWFYREHDVVECRDSFVRQMRAAFRQMRSTLDAAQENS